MSLGFGTGFIVCLTSDYSNLFKISFELFIQSEQMIAPPPPINLLPLDLGLPQNKHLGSLLLLLLLLSAIIFFREL